MTTDFFIRRPIFTIVISIILLIAGILAIFHLPIAKLPPVLPPTVQVVAEYPGASASVVESTVTTWLEEAINGTPGMSYISSQSNDVGQSIITVTFDLGYDINVGLLDVLDRVDTVKPRLPREVQHLGVRVEKVTPNLVMSMMLYDENNQYDSPFFSNYAQIYMLDEMARVPGVGSITSRGKRTYAMRIWLKPNELATRHLTANDVIRVIEDQNRTVAAGSTGAPPMLTSVKLQHSVNMLGRLQSPEEFGNIVVKPGTANSVVRLKDVAKIELGSSDYNQISRFQGHPSVAFIFQPLPNANIVEMAKSLKATVNRLAKDFPPGMKVVYPFDETVFVNSAIKEVIITLIEAIILVGLVIFFFLRDWRSTIIPMITIPITLLGTFSVMPLLGFSINLLTLFGMTLATGLVVDDAIVVVEHIYVIVKKTGLGLIEATIQAMKEIKGAIIASTLSLAAVFIPVSFFPGITGQLYKQFALTIAVSITLSLFISMTLAPALAPLLLKLNKPKPGKWNQKIETFLNQLSNHYYALLKQTLNHQKTVGYVFLGALLLTGLLFAYIPKSFLPEEDQGYFVVNVSGPSGTALHVTQEQVAKASGILEKMPGVLSTMSLAGYSMLSGNGSNYGNIFVNLKPWRERSRSAMALIKQFNMLQMKHNMKHHNHRKAMLAMASSKQEDWSIMAMNPPSIQGLSPVSGFQMEIETKAGGPLKELANTAQQVMREAQTSPDLKRVFSVFKYDNPGLHADINRTQALALGIPLSTLFETLQVYISSKYVNDFNLFGRIYQVFVQAEKDARMKPNDVGELYLRSGSGEMVALENLVKMVPTINSSTIYHYNLNRSAEIDGIAAPGVGSSKAMRIIEQIADKSLPKNMKYEWTGMSYQAIKAGKLGPFVFILGLLFVYLILSAQYESFVQPIIILFGVPLTTLGALIFLMLRGFSSDIYAQVGFVMLIGLATKNAILMIEVANHLRKEKQLSIQDAILTASHERLRPILMTSFAFIIGIFPMVIASGAGAQSRQSIGTTVFGGMIFSTLLGLIIIPVLYVIVEEFRKTFSTR